MKLIRNILLNDQYMIIEYKNIIGFKLYLIRVEKIYLFNILF